MASTISLGIDRLQTEGKADKHSRKKGLQNSWAITVKQLGFRLARISRGGWNLSELPKAALEGKYQGQKQLVIHEADVNGTHTPCAV